MSETVPRTRNCENSWRPNGSYNRAVLKYTREAVLSVSSTPQPIELPESLGVLLLKSPAAPSLSAAAPFTHSLGEEINSRKPFTKERKFEKIPEWFDEDAPLGHKEEEEKFAEESAKIDLFVEGKLKEHTAQEEPPEWDEPGGDDFKYTAFLKEKQPQVAAYNYQLVSHHRALGSLFAKALLELGRPHNGLLYIYPESDAYTKCWFYKDPDANTQGPFSVVEMFNWEMRGCFPPDLLVSLGGPRSNYVPLSCFHDANPIEEENAQEEKILPVEITVQKNEEATNVLKNLLGLTNLTGNG